MRRPLEHRTVLIAWCSGLFLCWSAVGISGAAIRSGDMVEITSGPAPVKLGDKVLATLDSGVRLKALSVRENWVAVRVEKDGREVVGWIHVRHLKKVPAPAIRPRLPRYERAKWTFTWVVVEEEDARVELELTPETLTIQLSERELMGDSLWLTPAEAAAIGRELANTRKHWEALRHVSGDAKRTATVGEYTISYLRSAKYGFSVHVRRSGPFMSSVALTRNEAEKLARYLAQAQALAKFAREHVKIISTSH